MPGCDRECHGASRDDALPPLPPLSPWPPLSPLPLPTVAGGCVGLPLLLGSRMVMRAPSRNLSAPSTTTLSPGARPDCTATRSPSVGPRLTTRTETVLFGFAR